VADEAASPAQQLKWDNNYATAETKVKFVGGVPVIPPGPMTGRSRP
jgi:hypothetical protein